MSQLELPLARRIANHILWVILFFLVSCNSDKPTQITYQLSRTDFIEKIKSRGTVQATSTLSVVAPRVNASNMTVVFLPDDGSHVKKGDTICILDAPDLISSLESNATSLESLQAERIMLIAENAMKLSLLEAQVGEMDARVAMNSLDSIQKLFAPAVRQKIFALELEKANVEKDKLQKKFIAQKKMDEADLRSINARITRSENDIQKVVEQINSLTIVAPQDGIVLHNEIPQMSFMGMTGGGTIGGKIMVNSKVFSTMVLLQMPDLKQMEIAVEVPEADYKRIKTGQKVHIEVEAASGLKTTGLVKRKTLVGKKAQDQTSLKNYDVILSVDSCHSQMVPGLSASCEIIVEEVSDTIVVPTFSIFERDSIKIIYVAEKGKFLPVPVEVGVSNSSFSIISKGLAGNETIALTEPSHKLVTQQVPKSTDTILIKETPDKVTLNNLNDQNP